jgi:dTDP-4-amino-4,6-dideoxygalactose transaminase
MIPVTKTFLPDIDVYLNLVKKIWNAGKITNNGPMYLELTQKLKHYLNCQNFELVANGTLALQLAIRALELRGEIITTPYSYVATTNAIIWEGCTPVFVDIDASSLCINPAMIEDQITSRTTAILATHVYGNACDVVEIEKIAKKHGLKVIYDASHAFGEVLHQKPIANFGDCSTLSFHATKLFHTAEGGAISTSDSELSKKIFLLSKFGHIGEDDYSSLGINAKISELHAAMGLALLPSINQIIEEKKQLTQYYDEYLDGLSISRPLMSLELTPNYSYYPILLPSNEKMMAVKKILIDSDIHPRRYFYPSLNTLEFLPEKSKKRCKVSEDVASRILCLPIYVGLQKEDVSFISSVVSKGL